MRKIVALCILFYLGSLYSASHHPQDFLKRIRGKPHEGRQIVQHYCANCHAKNPIIPVGAPRIGVPEDWAIRLKKGMSALFKHTDEGLNAMPARGGCFECSDEQLKLAIEYMLSKKEKM
jgi:cytochrome c5